MRNISVLKTSLKKFPTAEEAISNLRNKKYFVDIDDPSTWPEKIQTAINKGRNNNNCVCSLFSEMKMELFSDMLTPNETEELALRAFGVVVNYYKEAMVDQEVLSYGDIEGLDKISLETQGLSTGKSMVLYGDTIRNLDILPSAETRYSLFNTVNKTSTPFGKRLLKQWICNPLLLVSEIQGRQEAIKELSANGEMVEDFRNVFKKLRDLEKLMSWIHGACIKRDEHPELEAIYYETEAQMKRNIGNLVGCLKGFESVIKVLEKFSDTKFKSQILTSIVNDKEGLVEISDACQFFR